MTKPPPPDDAYVAVQSPRVDSAGSTAAEDDPWKSDLRSPLDRANWLSQFTLWWVNPAITRGHNKPIEEDDVWELPATDKAAVLQARFDKHYAEHAASHTDSAKPVPIYCALWNSTKDKMGVAIVLHLVSGTATMLQPLLIKALLQFLRDEPTLLGLESGYGLAALLTVTACVSVNTLDYGMYLTARAGINARMVAVNSVYQKVLKLTSAARVAMNSGDTITLAGVDSERLFEAYAIGIWVVVSPIMILVACTLLGFLMSFLVALAAGVCSVAILTFALTNSRRIGLTRREILQVAGERVKVTNEVLQGIRVIKMYAWEDSIEARVAEIRAREVALLRKYDYLRAYNMVALSYAQTLMTAACLLVYVYQGNTLTVPTAFALLAIANACRQPFTIFSNAVVFSSEGWASSQRIAKFLGADEVPAIDGGTRHDISQAPLLPGQPIVELHDADFTWDPHATRPILRNINFALAPGSLTIVVGACGSGKSSLVSALLGEMTQSRGTRAVRGDVAYASQQAWIQHNTVRDNILFGSPFDTDHYKRVIAACQLTRDLEILDSGDATEIGERGINLSGGQKARVSLARVMYRREADLVVLDDPLSALDVHVANAVFAECVQGLVAGKTRLLVLNAHYHLLRHADRIVMLADGEIVADGTYDEVKAEFAFLEDQAHEKAARHADADADACRDNALLVDHASVAIERRHSHTTDDEDEDEQANVDEDRDDELRHSDARDFSEGGPEAMERVRSSRRSRATTVVAKDQPPPKKMITEEDRAVGSITWRTYASFLECTGMNGVVLLVALAVVFVVGQCGLVAADYFVTFWSDGSLDHLSQKTLFWIYVGVGGSAVALGLARAAFFTEICIKCAQVVHTRYFGKVLRAPINTFFDVTPVGRVLNRFSRDLDQIDNPIPWYTLAFLIYCTMVLATFVVCAVTTPTTLILYAPLLYVAHVVQAYFLASSRELKRLDGVTRSPFLNLVAETINGIESIRAFKMTRQFSTKCRDLLDFNAKFFFMFQSANKWFAMRLDWLVTSVVAVVAFTCVASKDSIGSASVGIALTYAVQLTLQFQRLLTLSSMTENYMTSYERIAHFGTLNEEGDSKLVALATPAPPAAWPVHGTIEFEDVFLRYRDGLDYVLRGVSFTVREGEKVGVCGRTGSGKSTLMNALFRTVEAAHGTIRIDGVDIATVSLRQLRSRLTIIPQDPVLFSGSLRENLDPFHEKTDEELFSALRKVHLMEDVGRWGLGLAYQVSEKGENLSVGQRQLICIARALLRESKIIVLDEATANVDQELDRLIQVAVKECFHGRTALTIAHRLETIADSDRILVMDHGHVAEYDAPAALLARPDGIFASLMQSTTGKEKTEVGDHQ